MIYKIKYVYNTSDSFGNYPGQIGQFSYEFKDLDLAKIALERTKEHYEWKLNSHIVFAEKKEFPKWYFKDNSKSSDYIFNVIGNDGSEVWLNSFEYSGYFESLVSASIVKIDQYGYEIVLTEFEI